MNLTNYIIRRLLLMVLVLFGVSLIVFIMMMALPPGQRVAVYIHSDKIRPEQIDNLIEQYGLNDPAPVQYFRWMKKILKGDFGYSVTAEATVMDAFKTYFPVTLELVLYSMPLIILAGVAMGTAGAIHKDKPIDHATRVFAIIGYSLPTFWLGLMLLMLIYGWLGLFGPGVLDVTEKAIVTSPGFHRYTGLLTIDGILNWNWRVVGNAFYHLVLPTLNLVLLSSALILRLMRSSMLDALGQDYIRTALAKGADKKTIYHTHARRNALIPVITISGTMFAGLLAGMVITETIFVRPGIGRWTAKAAIMLDVPAIMFNVLFLGVVFVIANLIVDVIYAYVDPRIRLS